MPKRLIQEVDNTGAVQLSAISNTVYIPGKASGDAIAPKLFKAANDLKVEDGYDNDLSFKLAKKLLSLGIYVLYEGCTLNGSTAKKKIKATVSMTKEAKEGSTTDFVWKFKVDNIDYTLDGNDVTWKNTPTSQQQTAPVSEGQATVKDNTVITFDFINSKVNYEKEISASGTLNIDWDRLKNKTTYDIRFLTTGGYACPSNDMISCAANRGDCTALLDHAETLTIPTGSSQVEEVRKFFEGFNGNSTVNADANSFAAAFTPWFKTKDADLCGDADEVNIPASFGYLLAYARSIKNNPSWLPVAGSTRGVIPELSGVTYEYSEAEGEVLQARAATGEVELGTDDTPFLDGDNVGRAINPIIFMGESFGYLVWGNRTLRDNDVNKRTIATSFLNVRNLCSELKKAMEKASIKYTFEPNNDVLWINWQSQVTPVLNRMESGSGILGYKLIREKTSAKARMKAKCILVPVEGVEDFELKLQMEDSLSIVE